MIAVGLMLACGSAWSQTPAPTAAPAAAPVRPAKPTNWWSQAGGEGMERTVWAAHKTPETPYNKPNQLIWRIADILKAHQGQKNWDQPVMLTRDFDGHYISMAPGEKTKCMFYADDRVFGWIYSGQLKITIDGQTPTTATKGYLFNVAPRLSYCLENTGTEPGVFWRVTPTGQVPSYPENETPTPIKGYVYSKAKITSTGGYDETNKQPFLDFNAYAAGGGKSQDFVFDGHTSGHIIRGPAPKELAPPTSWGHFHENMVEAWVVIEGQLDVLVTGYGIVHGETGDVIQANDTRWHRATCAPNTGTCTRLAMTPRLKEGQVHYFQTDQPPGN